MITSNQNPRIQKVKALITRSKERRNFHQFVIEGVRLSEEALQAGWEFDFILFSENLSDRGLEVLEEARKKSIPIDQIPFSLMKKISGTETPQGIIAIIKQKEHVFPDQPNFILICDGIKDPGNLGTILRSADAAKTQAVILAPTCVDQYSPKVVRAGMGAHFHFPIISMDWDSITKFIKTPNWNFQTVVASADANKNVWQFDFRIPTAIIIGSESTGPSQEAYQLANEMVKIPMPGSSESLNAAIAASIILFEVVRQRWQ